MKKKIEIGNPNLPKWMLMAFGSLQQNIGPLSYFDQFTNRKDNSIPPFEYDLTNKKLKKVCEKYSINTVAGDGDAFLKAKNISKWLCENVPPGGAEGVSCNSIDLLNHSYQKERNGGKNGLRCDQFAVVYSELLLSVGIINRIVRLEGMNPNIGGNHWVNVVWSPIENKWIMIDAMYNAYYSDYSGEPLSPWELRHALVHQHEIVINKDWGSKKYNWNWNKQTLLVFYAKNLCCMGSPIKTGFGALDGDNYKMIWLSPKGFDISHKHLKTMRFYDMRDKDKIDFKISDTEYNEFRAEILSKNVFTSSIKAFAQSPE